MPSPHSSLPYFLACLPCLALTRGVLKPSLAKHMTRLEGNQATIPFFLASPCLSLTRGTLKPSLAKHMMRLEGNRATILAFYTKQDLENSIALLGAASKGDEEVRIWAKI